MPDKRPATHVEPVRRREALRMGAAVIVALLAIGFILADLSGDVLAAIARLAAAVSLVMLSVWLSEMRLDRRLARIQHAVEAQRQVNRSEYWKVYSDVLKDLGGVDGESSTDSGWLPPHP